MMSLKFDILDVGSTVKILVYISTIAPDFVVNILYIDDTSSVIQ